MAVLSVQNLRKVYAGKNPYVAVDDISFELKEGEILGLLGPNGAGKTTTIQMLMSTLAITSGKIVYFGKNLTKHRSEILQHVTFASTYVSLPWNLTVEQNLDVFGRLFSLSPKVFNKKRDALLERFGITEKKKSRVSSLSSGQVTRLMLVKAFMVNPRIVLLDEPTASLDPDIAKDVIEFILEQRKENGTSILFTSHNMGEVSEVCDRVLFLKKGKIFADDLPKNLAKKAARSKVELVIADGVEKALHIADELKMSSKIDHRSIQLELDESQIAHYLSALADAKVLYSNINIIQPTLEDFFLMAAKQKETP
ncbi:MAG: putative ABC transporter ATP-binding protein YbhF [Chlamydiae bacterium]|nr:putative ABC transporter ATP-binding protein YbhF [Chlamydiota bacterium]